MDLRNVERTIRTTGKNVFQCKTSIDLQQTKFNKIVFFFFKGYLEKIFANFDAEHLSYFEMNLETWRQLWRTVEISDIILMIVDVRFAVNILFSFLHFKSIILSRLFISLRHCTIT